MTPTDAEINAAITILRRCGYTITKPQALFWTTPAVMFREVPNLGTKSRFLDRLKHKDCPSYEMELGPSGRLLRLRPTPELIAFLKRP